MQYNIAVLMINS